MKLIFAGTPEFALPSLQALTRSKHNLCAVFTTPDRPAGRGLKLTASVVKSFAEAHHLPLFQPETFRDSGIQQKLRDLSADVFIDVACGLFLPKEVLTIPRYGCINIHPSLLPRWRGAAPIPRAIIAGDIVTGVTIMQIDEGLDTGDILKQAEIPITAIDTAATLLEKSAKIGANLLLEVLAEIEEHRLKPISQDNNFTTYAAKLTKDEARLNWQLSAEELARMVRALNPWPIAYAEIKGVTLRIWEAMALSTNLEISTVEAGSLLKISSEGIDVATKQGVLRLLKVQLPGKKVMTVKEILCGHPKFLS